MLGAAHWFSDSLSHVKSQYVGSIRTGGSSSSSSSNKFFDQVRNPSMFSSRFCKMGGGEDHGSE